MALVIRLRKPGKSVKRHYHYKIVVDEKRSKKEGRFLAQVGYYDPSKNPKIIQVDLDKYQEWIKKGALPTETVKELAKKFGKLNKKGE
ncbi:MAG: 30S ribosomal protein S16 [Candidatus Omnitrophica bacterium]|nr:30S ribosomal protein S16 [Candidatus Omnitrophota bacterium]